MHSIIFEHLKEDITLIGKEKNKQQSLISFFFFKTRGDNLKSLAQIFQLVIHSHLERKTPFNSFSVLTERLLIQMACTLLWSSKKIVKSMTEPL